MTSDVVTVATHSGCVPIFATEIAIDVVLSVVDVARAVVVFVDAALTVVTAPVRFVGPVCLSKVIFVLVTLVHLELLELRPLVSEFLLATTKFLYLCMSLFQMITQTLILLFPPGSVLFLANLDYQGILHHC